MKNTFKSFLYVCFLALVFVSCAKNDDFTIPNLDLECDSNISETITIAQLYETITETMRTYEQDDIISGYVVSSDQGGNLYQSIYFVDKNNAFSAVFKADIQAYYASYPVGTQIFIRLKGTEIQMNNSILTIGGKNATSDFVQVLAAPTYKKHIVRGCERLTPEEIEKNYTKQLSLQDAIKPINIGKLVTIQDVQFAKKFWGKTFFDPNNIVSDRNKATNNEIESKTNNPTSNVFFRVVTQTSGFANETVPAKSGSMTGIMTLFQSDAQFNPRTMKDLDGLDKEPFDTDGEVTPPGETEGKDVDGVNQNKPNIVADFSNWPSFIASTNRFGLLPFGTEAEGQGPDNKGALSIKGSPDKNEYLFTLENQSAATGAKNISFYVKGTTQKSLSLNVYRADGTYAVYNLATDAQIAAKQTAIITSDIVLTPTKSQQTGNPANGNNDYIYAKIDSPNKWIKITLDLKDVAYNTTGQGSTFALKIGSKASYDLLVSDIIFDTNQDGDTEPSEQVVNLTNFNTWDEFLKTLNKFGLQSYASLGEKMGPDNQNTMVIQGTPGGNDYLFTVIDQPAPKDAKTISFLVKGTSGKSISLNVYRADGSYAVYNIATDEQITSKETEILKADKTLYPTKRANSSNPANGTNDYIYGTIDTPDKWVKITLDLKGVEYNTTGKGEQFAFKVGSKKDYDIQITNILYNI
ncbi:DUF5689 domain-containing protein [Myroides sp. LJL115]